MIKKLNDVIWIKNSAGFTTNDTKNIEGVRTLLDSTGPGFCLAKFTQVTMHLGTGQVHSCHHPRPHKLSVEELAENPAALFNTDHLKKVRREMFEGTRPAECDYCWRIEDNKNVSDRQYKSLEPWALSKHDGILNTSPDDNIFPTYLEVDFSNVCNFKCIYCGPEFSSTWVEDLKRNGPIKLLNDTPKVVWAQGWQDLDSLTIKNRDVNPYVDAFWKWFPEAYKHLHVYRITGGEPLLSKETFRSMEWFTENPNPELEFSINSNLCAPDKLWDEFVKKASVLSSGGYVKKFTVFTSIDGWGERAEYMRPGLDFEMFKKRYEQLLEIGNIRCVVMCTFNVLSLTSIKELFKWQVELKHRYNADNTLANLEGETGFNLGGGLSYTARRIKSPDHYSVVGIDVPYLRHPTFLDAQLSTTRLVEDYLIPAMSYMANNTASKLWMIHGGFEEYEVEKFRRIVNDRLYFNKRHGDRDSEDWLITERAKFFDFVNEMDRRHGRDFLTVFPEMSDFYEICKQAKLAVN